MIAGLFGLAHLRFVIACTHSNGNLLREEITSPDTSPPTHIATPLPLLPVPTRGLRAPCVDGGQVGWRAGGLGDTGTVESLSVEAAAGTHSGLIHGRRFHLSDRVALFRQPGPRQWLRVTGEWGRE